MAKIKLSLTPNPTFKAKVGIPVPGQQQPVQVEFTFKSRTRKEFTEFGERLQKENPEEAQIIMDIASGWDLEEPFDKENVEKMLDVYMGSGQAIVEKYNAELTGARLGN